MEINHGQGSDLSIDNLAPGDSRVAYQLISADMDGVGAAVLSMTVSSAADSLFAQNAKLAIAVSAPTDHGALDCSANPAGFVDTLPAQPMSAVSATPSLALGTLTDTDDAVCVRFTIGLNKSAGNPVQGTTGSLAMTYTLTQASAANP